MNDQPRVERLDEVIEARKALASSHSPELLAVVGNLIDKVARFQDLWIQAEDRWRDGVPRSYMDEINRLRDILKTDEGSVERMTEALTLHHGERVAPVSDYCKAFTDWHKAIVVKVEELNAESATQPEITPEVEALPYDEKPSWYWHAKQLQNDAAGWQQVLDAMALLYLPVYKSSYLRRRVYGGETHRTEKCPVHKGRWSGCHPPDVPDGACECADTGDTTGWLPA